MRDGREREGKRGRESESYSDIKRRKCDTPVYTVPSKEGVNILYNVVTCLSTSLSL